MVEYLFLIQRTQQIMGYLVDHGAHVIQGHPYDHHACSLCMTEDRELDIYYLCGFHSR